MKTKYECICRQSNNGLRLSRVYNKYKNSMKIVLKQFNSWKIRFCKKSLSSYRKLKLKK